MYTPLQWNETNEASENKHYPDTNLKGCFQEGVSNFIWWKIA